MSQDWPDPNDKFLSDKLEKKDKKIKELNCDIELLEALPRKVLQGLDNLVEQATTTLTVDYKGSEAGSGPKRPDE